MPLSRLYKDRRSYTNALIGGGTAAELFHHQPIHTAKYTRLIHTSARGWGIPFDRLMETKHAGKQGFVRNVLKPDVVKQLIELVR